MLQLQACNNHIKCDKKKHVILLIQNITPDSWEKYVLKIFLESKIIF